MVSLGPTVSTVLIGLGIVVGLAILIFVWRRRAADEDNATSTEDRIEHQADRQEFHLPLRAKTRLMHPAAKLMSIGLFLGLAVVAYEVYSYMKTGSPTQALYSRYTQVAIATVIGCVGGFKYGRGKLRSEGYLAIEYEATPDNDRTESSTDTVPFDPDDITETEDGMVVHEQTSGRLYGIWRRALTVVEKRDLRATPRPDEDKVAHRVPDRALEVRPNVYHFRTKGQRTLRDPNAVADFAYKPSFSMSNREKLQLSSDMDMLETANEQLRARLAAAHAEITTLEDELNHAANSDWEDLLDRAQDIADLTGNAPMHYNYQRQQQAAHHTDRGSANGHDSKLNEINEILNGGDDS